VMKGVSKKKRKFTSPYDQEYNQNTRDDITKEISTYNYTNGKSVPNWRVGDSGGESGRECAGANRKIIEIGRCRLVFNIQ